MALRDKLRLNTKILECMRLFLSYSALCLWPMSLIRKLWFAMEDCPHKMKWELKKFEIRLGSYNHQRKD
jgi:hypothetical protein